jgi:DnaJ-class molecular chaperone
MGGNGMTWVIVQKCVDCGGHGELYSYYTTPNKCHECEGTGEKEYYEENYQYDTVDDVKEDYSNPLTVMLTN